jgi:hypothetical protein
MALQIRGMVPPPPPRMISPPPPVRLTTSLDMVPTLAEYCLLITTSSNAQRAGPAAHPFQRMGRDAHNSSTSGKVDRHTFRTGSSLPPSAPGASRGGGVERVKHLRSKPHQPGGWVIFIASAIVCFGLSIFATIAVAACATATVPHRLLFVHRHNNSGMHMTTFPCLIALHAQAPSAHPAHEAQDAARPQSGRTLSGGCRYGFISLPPLSPLHCPHSSSSFSILGPCI